MSDRSKYSLNGVYKCENFAQYIENANFPFVPIGSALDLDGWYIKLRTSMENDIRWLYPSISHRRHPNIRIRACYKILKKDGFYAFECQTSNLCLNADQECCGKNMNIEALLDEKYGYLDDGALTVEYGLQVVAEEGQDGIWKFNFHDKFFEWQTKDHMFEFTFEYRVSVFSHKQIIKLQSTTIDASKNSMRVPTFFDSKAFHMCAQITHGVRLQITAIDLQNVARVAFYFGFSNTVRYCEKQLIVLEPTLKINLFKLAVKFNMRSYLVHLLKQIETNEHLVKIMRGLNLEKMSSESMKAIAAKIFSL